MLLCIAQVWDALTNTDVVRIVASARKRSMAAELLVRRAVRAWKRKFPASKIDDCAAICLYLKDKPASSLTHSTSHVSRLGKVNDSELSLSYYSTRSNIVSDQGGTASEINSKMTEDWKDTVLNCNVSQDAKEEWNALKEVDRVNTMLKLPQFSNGLSRRKTSRDYEEVQAH